MDRTQRNSVVMYRVQIEALIACSSLKDVKAILAMIIARGMNGEEVNCPEHLRMVWTMFQSMLDANTAKLEATRERNSTAGRLSASKRGNRQQVLTDVNECQQVLTDVNECQQVSTNNVYVYDNDISLPNGSDINARERATLTRYPSTVMDVMRISIAINSPMTEAQAQAYLDQRTRADWHQGAGGTGRKIRPENIPADIRLWIDRDKANAARSGGGLAENMAVGLPAIPEEI